MKFIKKISAMLLIALLSISNVIAAGIPDEPMVIYGNINGIQSGTNELKILDGNDKVLKTIIIKENKYGTKKTFDLDNKIVLDKFDGTLKFKVNNYDFVSIKKGETNGCDNSAKFQKAMICEYNLVFKTSGGITHHHSHHHSSHHSNSSSNNGNSSSHHSSSNNSGSNTNNNHDSNNSQTNNNSSGEDTDTDANADTDKNKEQTNNEDTGKKHDYKFKNIKPEIVKKVQKKVKFIPGKEKYNKLITLIGVKVEQKIFFGNNKNILFDKLNEISKIKAKQHYDKKEFKGKIKDFLRTYKLIKIKEKILKKLKFKKGNNYIKQNKENENPERTKKMQELKKRILERLKLKK